MFQQPASAAFQREARGELSDPAGRHARQADRELLQGHRVQRQAGGVRGEGLYPPHRAIHTMERSAQVGNEWHKI